MKIFSVNPVSFGSIKVSKEKKNTDTVAKTANQEILDSWGRSLDIIKTASDAISTDPKLKKTDKGKISKRYDGRNVYIANIDSIDGVKPFVSKKVQILNSAIALANENMALIKKNENSRDNEKKIGENTEVIVRRKEDFGMTKVAGYKDDMRVIYERFIDEVEKEERGEEADVFGSILFFGPSGNGKTHITEAVAEETDCNIIPIELGMDDIESTNYTMKQILEEAQKAEERFQNGEGRTILFIDEVDNLISKTSPVTKVFEEFIKTCSKKYHCTVFAATNDPLDLGVNMKDEDVFTIKMAIDPPDVENAAAMFKYQLKDYPKEELDYEELAQELFNQEELRRGQFNNGQILNICKGAYKNREGEVLKQSDIIKYMQEMPTKPEISDEMGEKFSNEYEELILK